MFCSKCGKPLPEGAEFCESCGNPMTSSVEAGPGASPPPAGTAPPGPPMPPGKSNTLLYVLLGVAVAALAGVVVAVILLTSPPSNTQPAATTSPTSVAVTPYVLPTEAPTNAYTSGPTASAAALRVYPTPTFSTGLLQATLPGSKWEFVGIATNENQAGGSEGTYTLDDFKGYAMRLDFDTSGTLTVTRRYQGEDETTFTLEYTINDTYCQCEDDGNGNVARFYLGADGNLYLTFVTSDKEMTDFNVYVRTF